MAIATVEQGVSIGTSDEELVHADIVFHHSNLLSEVHVVTLVI